MADEIVQAHVFIEGRVQGVFYRFWAKEEAEKLGLTGWVRNTEDGKVEAVFQGKKEKVEKMIEKCHKGSHLADVKNLDINWEELNNNFTNFEVL
jgi:acylphosphatase